MKRCCTIALAGLLAWTGAALGQTPTPSSTGPASRVDTPILRVPAANEAPTIDGKFEEGEWEDASALSAFWYDFSFAKFLFLAPDETQVEVYASYDEDNLYLAYLSPVYPAGSWLKARPDAVRLSGGDGGPAQPRSSHASNGPDHDRSTSPKEIRRHAAVPTVQAPTARRRFVRE